MRPVRGAVSVPSLISATTLAIAAFAASTEASALTTCAFAALMPASDAASCAFAASTAAFAPCWLARSLSSTWRLVVSVFTSSSERASLRSAASSWASCWATTAAAAARSASRCVTMLFAVSIPMTARFSSASAWLRFVCSCSMSIWARTCPFSTKSPSLTRISFSRPGVFVEMSISTASMRPLPLAMPAGRSSALMRCQAKYVPPATTMAAAARSHDLVLEFIARTFSSSLRPGFPVAVFSSERSMRMARRRAGMRNIFAGFFSSPASGGGPVCVCGPRRCKARTRGGRAFRWLPYDYSPLRMI